MDDHPVVLEVITYRLNCEPDFVVCGAVTSGAEALVALTTLRPTVVVLDLVLPDNTDLQLIRQIKLRQPQCRMVVYSGQDEFVYAEQALWAGAQGYVMKSEPPASLVQAVRKVLSDEIALSSAMTKHILRLQAGRVSSRPLALISDLTSRELEIFRLIGAGKKRSAIAKELSLSPKNVEAHRANMREKLQQPTAHDLYHFAYQTLHAARGGSATRRRASKAS